MSPLRRLPLGCLALLLLLAAWLRLPASPQPALWNDEAWRALVVVETSSLAEVAAFSRETLFPLMPQMWALGKLGVAALGPETEWAFRLWPLLAGVASVALAFLLAQRAAGPWAGVLAAALLAAGPGFVLHSREWKPYLLDVCFALAACALACAPRRTEAGDPPGAGPGDPPAAGAGLVTLLCVFAVGSTSFVFVYPAVLAHAFFHRRLRRPAQLAPLLVPGAIFTAWYFAALLPIIRGATLIHEHWSLYFPTSGDGVAFLAGEIPRTLDLYVPFGWQVALASFLVATPLLAWRRGDGVAWLLLGPLLVQLGLSLVGVHPLLGRASTFLFALVAVSVAYAAAGVLGAARRRGPGAGHAALAAAALAGLLLLAVHTARDPYPLPTRPLRSLPGALAHAATWPPDMGKAALARFDAEAPPEGALLLGSHAYWIFQYYRAFALPRHPRLAALSRAEIDRSLRLDDATDETLCRSFRARSGALGAGPLWIFSSGNFEPEVYRRVLGRLGRVTAPLDEPHQALFRVAPERPPAALECLESEPLEPFVLAPGAPARSFAVRNFPGQFVLAVDARGPAGARGRALEIRLLGEAGEVLGSAAASLGAQRLSQSAFSGFSPEAAGRVRALELRLAAGAPARVAVRGVRVR